jgi:thiamine biosynthesis protein ThiS
MKVRVNGEERDVAEGTTVAGLLDLFELSRQRVAVEKNGRIVTRADYERTEMVEGDRIEIVQFVGGG